MYESCYWQKTEMIFKKWIKIDDLLCSFRLADGIEHVLLSNMLTLIVKGTKEKLTSSITNSSEKST